MSVRPATHMKKSQIGAPVIIVAVAILAILVGGLSVHYFGSQRVSSHNTGPVSANQRWIDQKAQESGGDFDRLSMADKQKLWQISSGPAPLALQMAYQRLNNK